MQGAIRKTRLGARHPSVVALTLIAFGCGATRSNVSGDRGGKPNAGDTSTLVAGSTAAAAGSSAGGNANDSSGAGEATSENQSGGKSTGGMVAGDSSGGTSPANGGTPSRYPEPPAFKNYSVTGSWPNQPVAIAAKPGKLTYQKLQVHDRFLAESCAIGDYNNDGDPDISSGRRWYEGPTFATEHIFRGGHDDLPRTGAGSELYAAASDDTSDFAFDVNGDGWVDIIDISSVDAPENLNPTPQPAPQTHSTAFWYENPGRAPSEAWTAHLMNSDVRAEQHGLVDVNGDGWPEFYGACKSCSPNETKGYYQADWTRPNALWTYHAVTKNYPFPFGHIGKVHGLGFGDVNQDGQPDLLERGGVWLDAQAPEPNLVPCPAADCGWVDTPLYDGLPDAQGNKGGSHMFSYDVDGDGDMDIVAADWAHGWGLAWYEQTAPLTFTKRQFMASNSTQDIAKYGPVAFSQLHSLQVADMDADGIPDIITGKMHFAHPLDQGDPDPNGAPVLYVFKTLRDTPSAANGGSVTFQPIQVDKQVGVGQQIAIGHLNKDGILDICVATKLGLYAFLGQ
jgi:hypothetical protein